MFKKKTLCDQLRWKKVKDMYIVPKNNKILITTVTNNYNIQPKTANVIDIFETKRKVSHGHLYLKSHCGRCKNINKSS